MDNNQFGVLFSRVGGREVSLFVGSKPCGPILQYNYPTHPEDADKTSIVVPGFDPVKIESHKWYNGDEHVYFSRGAWTNLYSRGDFGKNYICGGHWSSHSKCLHPRIKTSMPQTKDKQCQWFLADGAEPLVLPAGIEGHVTVTDLDCSIAWSIWYPSARKAIKARLSPDEIALASLPSATKKHLFGKDINISALLEFVDAIKL